MLIGYFCFGFWTMSMCSLYLSWIKCDLSMSISDDCDYNQIANDINIYLQNDKKSQTLINMYENAIIEWHYCESSRILRYTIVIFSYIFGVTSQVFFKHNRITIPYFQVK